MTSIWANVPHIHMYVCIYIYKPGINSLFIYMYFVYLYICIYRECRVDFPSARPGATRVQLAVAIKELTERSSLSRDRTTREAHRRDSPPGDIRIVARSITTVERQSRLFPRHGNQIIK